MDSDQMSKILVKIGYENTGTAQVRDDEAKCM